MFKTNPTALFIVFLVLVCFSFSFFPKGIIDPRLLSSFNWYPSNKCIKIVKYEIELLIVLHK